MCRNCHTYVFFVVLVVAAVIWGCSAEDSNPLNPPQQNPLFVFGDLEAVHLTYQVRRSLLPKIDYYDRIRNELAAIRAAYPDMEDVGHLPLWVAGEVLVKFSHEAMEQIRASNYHDLDSLEEELGRIHVDTSWFRISWGKLTFDQPYHAGVLSDLVVATEGIVFAEPNHYIGDGDHIEVAWPHYIFSRGWGDCPSGCIYRHYWRFYVDEDTVYLAQEYGDNLSS